MSKIRSDTFTKVEIPAIQNNTAFAFTCGVEATPGTMCVFFYTTEVNGSEGENLVLTAVSSAYVQASVGDDTACPSTQVWKTLDTARKSRYYLKFLSTSYSDIVF